MSNGPVRALVVSGGGAKGAFAVGAIDHLIVSEGLQFNMIAGTSTGALIAPYVAAGDHALLAQEYLDLETEHFVRRHPPISLFTHKSIFDTAPFEEVLRTRITPDRAKRAINSSVWMFIATVGLRQQRLVYWHNGARPTRPPQSEAFPIRDLVHLRRVMEASSNQPVFMRPVKLRETANQDIANADQYVDGGVKEYAPISITLENNAEHVYAIILSPEQKPAADRDYKTAAQILVRTFGIFMENVGESDVVDAERLAAAKGAKIKYIRPSSPLPTNSLEVTPQIQGLMYQMGRDAARAAGVIS